MTANPILLQKKYARVVEQFARKNGLSLDEALDFFYHSETYRLISEGAVSYTHLPGTFFPCSRKLTPAAI